VSAAEGKAAPRDRCRPAESAPSTATALAGNACAVLAGRSEAEDVGHLGYTVRLAAEPDIA